MKKIFSHLFPALFLLTFPAFALGEGAVSVDSATILRFSQNDRPGFPKENYMPATQFLGVDADKLADGNLSLHLY